MNLSYELGVRSRPLTQSLSPAGRGEGEGGPEADVVEEVYRRLAKHLSSLAMGYPQKEKLIDILRGNFTPLEAEVALAIKNFKELHEYILSQRKWQ